VILIFVIVFGLALGIFFVVTRSSKGEKVTAARVEKITAVGGVVHKDRIIVDTARAASTSNVGKHIDTLIQQGAVPMDRTTVMGLMVGGGIGCALIALLVMPSFVTFGIGAVAGTSLPYLYLRIKRSRRLKAFDKELPDTIDLLSRAVKSGHAVPAALDIAHSDARQPVKAEMGILVGQMNFGIPLDQALLNWGDRVESQDLRFIITAILIQNKAGGNLPELLERTTHTIRERARINGELRVKTAQGRLSAIVLVLLPIFLAIALMVVDPGWLNPLVHEEYGHYMLYYALVSLSIGSLCVYAITRPEV
jgi:tight adherence protein B